MGLLKTVEKTVKAEIKGYNPKWKALAKQHGIQYSVSEGCAVGKITVVTYAGGVLVKSTHSYTVFGEWQTDNINSWSWDGESELLHAKRHEYGVKTAYEMLSTVKGQERQELLEAVLKVRYSIIRSKDAWKAAQLTGAYVQP